MLDADGWAKLQQRAVLIAGVAVLVLYVLPRLLAWIF